MAYDLLAKLKLQDDFSGKLQKVDAMSRKFQGTIDSVNRSTSRMQTVARAAHGAMITLGDGGKRAISGIGSAVGKTIGAVTSLKGALLGAGTAYAAVINPLKLSSDAEQAGIAFETMLGSAEKAQKFLTDLTQFANATPFELPGLRDSAKKMLAFQFAASDIIPTLTAAGNAAAGLGLGADGIDRITVALGQMKAKGRVQGDELLQLQEAGIPAMDILAKKMQITTGEVLKLSEKGLIPADKAIKTLVDGMSDRFPNMMAKQSKSLAGLWSTMKDVFNNGLVKKWGDGIANSLHPRFLQLTTWIENNGATIDRWGQKLQDVASRGSDWVVKKVEEGMTYLRTKFFDNPEWAKMGTSEKISAIASDIGSKMGSALMSAMGDAIKVAITTHPILSMLLAGVLVGKAARMFGEIMVTVQTLTGGGLPNLGLPGGKPGTPASPTTGTGKKSLPLITNPWLWGGVAATSAMLYSSSAWENAHNDPNSKFYNSVMTGDAPHLNGTPLPTAPAMSGSDIDSLANYAKGLSKVNGSNAGGLSRVAYNGYVSELHKDEMVLTKSQADDYRSGSGGSTFNVTVNYEGRGSNFTKQDAHQMAQLLAYEMNEVVMAGG